MSVCPYPGKTLYAATLAVVLGAGATSARSPATPKAEAPPVQGEAVVIAVPQGGKPAANCLRIRQIEVRGIELLPQADLRAVVEPQAVECLSNESAQKIVVAINEAHSKRGLVTTQGYVPQQDIKKTGRFIINVITGRVGKVIYRETRADQGMPEAWRALRDAKGPWDLVSGVSDLVDTLDNAFDRAQLLDPKTVGGLKGRLATPLDEGEPVDLEKIQQGVDQLNKATSQKATAKLEAGEKPGTSNVVLNVPRKDSFRLSAGYEVNGASLNNTGNSTAKRLRMDIAKDNWLGINDLWSTSLAGGLNTNEVKGSVAVPWRWFTLSLDGGYSESLTPLGASSELFSQTWTSAANLNWLASRDKDQQTNITGGLNWRLNRRFVNSVELTPQAISYARIGASHTRFWDDRQLVLSLGASQGLSILDATKDPATKDGTTPRAQFFKLDGLAQFTQAFRGWGTWRLDLNGQWTPHPLYSDDQLILGSISSVRGFTRAPFRADRGGIIRSEFSTALPMERMPAFIKAFQPLHDSLAGTQFYSYADFGSGRDLANRRDVARAAIGAGLRYRYGRLTADLSIAQPVFQKGISSARDTYHPEFYVSLTAKAF